MVLNQALVNCSAMSASVEAQKTHMNTNKYDATLVLTNIFEIASESQHNIDVNMERDNFNSLEENLPEGSTRNSVSDPVTAMSTPKNTW